MGDRSAALAERALLAGGARELDRSGVELRLERLHLRTGRRELERDARAVGPRAVDEVVVDLHDDRRALRQAHAGPRRERVVRLPRYPDAAPAVVVDVV